MSKDTPPDPVLYQRIVKDGVVLRVGLFSIGVKIQIPKVAREFLSLYEGYPFDLEPHLTDFQIELKRSSRLRFVLRRYIEVLVDRQNRFEPLPAHLGIPMLESAINWRIGRHIAPHLLLHAAVVERDGRAVVLPGASGSGKSTLTAALVANGWRLLSDEVAMIDLRDGMIRPHPRPISLKNEAIDIVVGRYSQLSANKRYEGTTKGTVAYIRAPNDAIQSADCSAEPFLVVAPQYKVGAKTTYDRLQKAQALTLLVKQSPNYRVLLERGFHSLADFIEACDSYTLTYSELDGAIGTIEELSRSTARSTQAA